MVNVFFQIKEREGKFYISPIDAQTNGKYLIENISKIKAEEIKQRLVTRSLLSPIEDNASYENISVFNGIPIYRVK